MKLDKYISCILCKLSKKKKKVEKISNGDTEVLIKYLVYKLSKKKILNSDVKQFKVVLKIKDTYFFKQLRIIDKKINLGNFVMSQTSKVSFFNMTQLNSTTSVSATSSKYSYNECSTVDLIQIFYFGVGKDYYNKDPIFTNYNPSDNTLISTDFFGNIFLYDRDNRSSDDVQYMLKISGNTVYENTTLNLPIYQLYKTISDNTVFGVTGNYLFSTDMYNGENIYSKYLGLFTTSLKNSFSNKFNTSITGIIGYDSFKDNFMENTTFCIKDQIITYSYDNIKQTTGFDMRRYYPFKKSINLNSIASSSLPNVNDEYNGNIFITIGDYDNTSNGVTKSKKTHNTIDYRGTTGYYGIDENNEYNLYTYCVFKMDYDTENTLYLTSRNNKGNSDNGFPKKVSIYDSDGTPYDFEDDTSNPEINSTSICEIKGITQYSTTDGKCFLYLIVSIYYEYSDSLRYYLYTLEPYVNSYDKVKIVSVAQINNQTSLNDSLISVSAECISNSYGANTYIYLLFKNKPDYYVSTSYKTLYYLNTKYLNC